MPAPPGPPERYTSVGPRPRRSRAAARACSGTVPGIAPAAVERDRQRRALRRRVGPAPGTRQLSAQDAPGSASEAASAATSPSASECDPGHPRASLRAAVAQRNRGGRPRAERDLDERLVAGAAATEVGAEERERPAVERDRLRCAAATTRAAPARPTAAARPWRAPGTGAARARRRPPRRGRRSRAAWSAASAPSRSSTSAHSTRARRGGSSSASPSASARRPRRARSRAAPPRRASTSSVGPVAQERERHVQRLVAHAAARRPGPPARVAERRERVRAARGQVERDEQPQLSVEPSSSRRSRCIVTVVVRSRTIARLPGSCTVRSIRAPPRSRHATGRPCRPACPRVPPPGPAIPVMPMPDVRAEARDRAVGERRARPRARPRRGARSAPPGRPPAPTLASLE